MREFERLTQAERRRFSEHLGQLAKRDANVMHQIKRLESNGKKYRLKAGRKWAIVFDWEGQVVTLDGFRYRGDKLCYKNT